MNIRKIRERKKISQWTLSELSSVPQSTLALYESQTRTVKKPNKTHLERIASVLKVTVEDLLEDEKPNKKLKCLNQVCLLNNDKMCVNPMVLTGKADCFGKNRISDPDMYDPYNKKRGFVDYDN